MKKQNTMELYIRNAEGNFEIAGYEFSGWPANGIWVVEDGKYNCIYPFKDVPEMPSPSLISYMKFKEELEEVLTDRWRKDLLSVRDIANIACEFFAIKAGAIKTKDEIIEG